MSRQVGMASEGKILRLLGDTHAHDNPEHKFGSANWPWASLKLSVMVGQSMFVLKAAEDGSAQGEDSSAQADVLTVHHFEQHIPRTDRSQTTGCGNMRRGVDTGAAKDTIRHKFTQYIELLAYVASPQHGCCIVTLWAAEDKVKHAVSGIQAIQAHHHFTAACHTVSLPAAGVVDCECTLHSTALDKTAWRKLVTSVQTKLRPDLTE